MNVHTIIFLHGFASSSRGTKAQFLREQCAAEPDLDFYALDFNPAPADFEYMTVTGMINRLRQFLLDRQPASVSLVGSSFGGLVGLHYAHRFGHVKRLLLLAPALVYRPGRLTEDEKETWRRDGVTDVFHYAFGRPLRLRYDIERDGHLYQEPPPPPAPATIIHGRSDDVVPIAGSRDYAGRYPDTVRLLGVDAGHDLNAHLDLIWQEVQSFLLERG